MQDSKSHTVYRLIPIKKHFIEMKMQEDKKYSVYLKKWEETKHYEIKEPQEIILEETNNIPDEEMAKKIINIYFNKVNYQDSPAPDKEEK